MDCDHARVLISADADGELVGDEGSALAAHLGGCPACRLHADRVAVLTRSVRLRTVEPVPDLAHRVLDRARPARLGRGEWMRPALVWVALVIAAQSVGPLVLGEVSGASTHVARHLGAFALALAVGLLYAAWRPHRAFGLLPFAAALVATTVVGGVLDVVSSRRAAMSEAAHVSELAGLVLLWMIAGSPGWDRVRAVGPPVRR